MCLCINDVNEIVLLSAIFNALCAATSVAIATLSQVTMYCTQQYLEMILLFKERRPIMQVDYYLLLNNCKHWLFKRKYLNGQLGHLKGLLEKVFNGVKKCNKYFSDISSFFQVLTEIKLGHIIY